MTESFYSPVIGITTYGINDLGCFYLPRAYVNAVRRAGGLPILLPPGELHLSQILDLVDGLLLAGGGDIDPTLYQGPDHPAIYRVDPERDAFELTLAQAALKANIPLLGICRGLQILSVAEGAKLIAHVPDAFGTSVIHRAEEACTAEHSIQVVPGSQLASIFGQSEVRVTSMHHQAAQQVPPGWQASAYASDGLIEAIEHPLHPWAIAVQWHPELSPTDPLQQRIFESFITAAQSSNSLNRYKVTASTVR